MLDEFCIIIIFLLFISRITETRKFRAAINLIPLRHLFSDKIEQNCGRRSNQTDSICFRLWSRAPLLHSFGSDAPGVVKVAPAIKQNEEKFGEENAPKTACRRMKINSSLGNLLNTEQKK
jgi:hypothetical protein